VPEDIAVEDMSCANRESLSLRWSGEPANGLRGSTMDVASSMCTPLAGLAAASELICEADSISRLAAVSCTVVVPSSLPSLGGLVSASAED
jgi:hypothetical protein